MPTEIGWRTQNELDGGFDTVSEQNPFPVQIIQSSSGSLTNYSGTITTGGVAQTPVPANGFRRYLLIQNPTTGAESFWINMGATAVIASPSIEIAPGVTIIFEDTFIPTGAISVIATTTATAFTIKAG